MERRAQLAHDAPASQRATNRHESLSDIYMGITYYHPGQRFRGLFPVRDFLQQTAEALQGMVVAPGQLHADIASPIEALGTIPGEGSQPRVKMAYDLFGGGKDTVENLKKMHVGRTSAKATLATTDVYIKFHYLQEKGMEQIGPGSRIPFKRIHSIVLSCLSQMSPIVKGRPRSDATAGA